VIVVSRQKNAQEDTRVSQKDVEVEQVEAFNMSKYLPLLPPLIFLINSLIVVGKGWSGSLKEFSFSLEGVKPSMITLPNMRPILFPCA
jgi:hypothetical protein